MKHNPHQIKNGTLPKKSYISSAKQFEQNCYSYEGSINTFDKTPNNFGNYNPKPYEFQLTSGLKFKPKNIKSQSRDGVAFDSKIERIYYMYKKYIEHTDIKRNTDEHLDYTNCYGRTTWFYPDFKENGVFVELKGIVSPDDAQKRQQHPEVVWVVQSEAYGKALLDSYREKLDLVLPNWRKM